MSSEIDVRLFDIYTLSLQFAGRHFHGKAGKRTCRMSAKIHVRQIKIFDENYHSCLVIHFPFTSDSQTALHLASTTEIVVRHLAFTPYSYNLPDVIFAGRPPNQLAGLQLKLSSGFLTFTPYHSNLPDVIFAGRPANELAGCHLKSTSGFLTYTPYHSNLPDVIFTGRPANALAGCQLKSTSGKLRYLTKILTLVLSSTSHLLVTAKPHFIWRAQLKSSSGIWLSHLIPTICRTSFSREGRQTNLPEHT
ncbi:hypothetical protein [Fundicoccus culcitae]|uniref:Uncharacterized protein n=1 Tax=Fundicoccus culcitae TaxID=2969821 RepID=A0ABY5P3I7_9LACT|nr:hypothetical protein [Fundicoccus culcitae]UUX33296.1 hypothetical protein NRE15_10335 [Fundicoccus culcitae]